MKKLLTTMCLAAHMSLTPNATVKRIAKKEYKSGPKVNKKTLKVIYKHERPSDVVMTAWGALK
jgi:hypothetical protein